MAFPTKAMGLFRAGMALAAVAAFTPGGALAAGVPRRGAEVRLDARALARLIDRAIRERLSAEKEPAAPLADDAEFLRRAYLDITGVIPPAGKVREFLDSKLPDKR